MKIHARHQLKESTNAQLARDGKILTACGTIVPAMLGTVLVPRATTSGYEEERVTCPKCKEALAVSAIKALTPDEVTVHALVKLNGKATTACGTRDHRRQGADDASVRVAWGLNEVTCLQCLVSLDSGPP